MLIVEDEWAIADWLEVLLGENGYNVLSAGNGREAVELAEKLRPDVVVMDVAMPELNGIEEMLTPAGDLRTLPCHLADPDSRLAGLDGFFAARLERI